MAPRRQDIDTTTYVTYVSGNTEIQHRRSMADTQGAALKAMSGNILELMLGNLQPLGEGHVAVTMHMLEYLCVEHLEFAQELMDEQKIFTITPKRISALLLALKDAGIPTTKVETIDDVRAVFSMYMKKLLPEQRTVDVEDVIVADEPTGTFLDHLSMSKLRKGDDNNAVWLQLRQMIPYIYVKEGWAKDDFTSAVDDIVAGLDMPEGASLQKTASAVVAWLRETRPQKSTLMTYAHPRDNQDEIQRRFAKTEEQRFRPIFEANWSRAFPPLLQVYDHRTEGVAVAASLKVLLLSTLGSACTLTADTVQAFLAMTASKLKVLQVPSLEDEGDIQAANEARRCALQEALGLRGQTAAADKDGGVNGPKERESTDALLLNPSFQELLREVDALQTAPSDGAAAVLAFLKSPSAAGIMAVAGRAVPISQFRALRGIAIDSTTIHLVSAFEKKLVTDKAGKFRPDWQSNLSEVFLTKFIKGKLAFGPEADQINYWRELKNIITAREGSYHVDKINKADGEPTHPLFTFLLPQHMEMLLTPMSAMYTILGYGGEQPGSFNAIWRNIMSRTKEIYRIPDTDSKRMGCLIMHVSACALIFSELAKALRAMHAQPLGVADKPLVMLSEKGRAADAWKRVTGLLEEITKEQEVSSAHVSKRQRLVLMTLQEQVDNVNDILASTAEAKAVFAFFGCYPNTGPSRHNRAETPRVQPTMRPTNNADEWGSKAAKAGVKRSNDFKTIWFGPNLEVKICPGSTTPNDRDCLAKWHPNPAKRDLWCIFPHRCTNHNPPSGITTNETWNGPPPPPDAVVVVPATNTRAGSSGSRKGQTMGGKGNQQARGGGGRGRGNGASGGKGDNLQPSKGAKGGRAKGAGGRGQGFQRQRPSV